MIIFNYISIRMQVLTYFLTDCQEVRVRKLFKTPCVMYILNNLEENRWQKC